MPSAPSLDQLKQLYKEAGQEHVFTFYDKLAPNQQALLLAQLASIDILRVNRIFKQAISSDKAPVEINSHAEAKPLPTEACESTLTGSRDSEKQWRKQGLEAISRGQVAVLLLAGGQGTRLGSSKPKGCYDILLPSHKTLFQYQAERIASLEKIASKETGASLDECRIRWYVMTSGPTRVETENFFESKEFFGLKRENVIFFEQGILPALSNEGKLLLATPSTLAVAPDGNGGLYAALRQPLSTSDSTTVLSDLSTHGVQYIHGYCVDNCLVKVADPVFIGCCVAKQAACGAKVVRKTVPTESVGVLAAKGDGYAVVEYSELPKEKSEQRDANGELAFKAANIANHFYTLDFLQSTEAMEAKMSFHIARKKIPTVDLETGDAVQPTTPNGMKLELFIFDVFPFTKSLAVLEVERKEEFSPLKNAPGSAADSPETSRADLLAQQRRWLEAAGAKVADGVDVELSPLLTYSGEGLEAVKGKVLNKGGPVETIDQLLALAA